MQSGPFGQLNRQVQSELDATRKELAALVEARKRDAIRYGELVAIVEASRDAIWSWKLDGTISSWNAEAERLLHYTAEEIIGKSLLILVAPDRVERAREIIAGLLQGRWYGQYDTVRLRKDGTPIAVELTVSPIRGTEGTVIGAATVCRDITARKEQERALRESEERFAKLFQLAPIALSVSTIAEGRYLAVNASLLETTGYKLDEVVGHTARELKVYADLADFRRIRELLATSQSVRGLELGLRGKQGDVRTALFSADVVDLNNKPCLLAAVVDITERKQAEATIATSEARLRAVLQSLYDGVAAVDAQGKLVFINDAMAKLLGFSSAAELPPIGAQEALSRIQALAEDGTPLDYAERPLVRALAGETVIDMPLRMHQPAQGREYDVLNTAIPVRDASGNVAMGVVRMRDITEQKGTMRALKLSEERYAMALGAIDAMVYDWDVANGSVKRSDALQHILGLSPDEVEPTVEWWRSRIHPDDRSNSGSQVEAALADRQDRQLAEYRIRHCDGHYVHVVDRSICMYDSAGKPVRVVGSTVDVTRSKQAQEALKESEARYRSLVENANDIVAMLDLEFRFTAVNPAVQRILGYTPAEIIGAPLSRFVPEDQLVMHRDMLAQKLSGAATTQYEMQLYGKDRRRRFTLEVNSKLLVDGSGRPTGIHAIARDITERKEAEARQALLVRELQHRTKNMLAVVQSVATQTLTRSRDLESAREALMGRLHALANAQEFVAAGTGGGVPLRDLLEAELSAFEPKADIRGTPIVISGTSAQTLALIVHELATNAMKHGALSIKHGRIEINWTVDDSQDVPVLHLAWLERDGPSHLIPGAAGFGTQILRMFGDATLNFGDKGFEYRLAFPLEGGRHNPEVSLGPSGAPGALTDVSD
jgi:PAS domain S-box-containing protein